MQCHIPSSIRQSGNEISLLRLSYIRMVGEVTRMMKLTVHENMSNE